MKTFIYTHNTILQVSVVQSYCPPNIGISSLLHFFKPTVQPYKPLYKSNAEIV